MARTHLTLAALATSAMPGLDVVQARSHSYGAQGDYDSALLHPRKGQALIIRVPTNQAAESEQGAELVALRALTAGVRSRLPFAVPAERGQAPVGATRCVLYGFLAGDKVVSHEIDRVLAENLGRAIAAIHSLPTAFVGEAGLPVLSAVGCHERVAALVSRAVATRSVPAALRDRWKAALDDAELWQFQPTVLHGSLSADSFLLHGDDVAAVLGWSGLGVGDPARDLHWLSDIPADAAQAALAGYLAERGFGPDPLLGFRATLYGELEVARWLLHGHEVHDSHIVEDAIALMDNLVESVHGDVAEPLAPATGPIPTITEVQAMLDFSSLSSAERADGLAPIVDAEDDDDAATHVDDEFGDERERSEADALGASGGEHPADSEPMDGASADRGAPERT